MQAEQKAPDIYDIVVSNTCMLAKGTALGYFLQTLCVFIEPADSWRGSDLCMAFPTTLLLLLDSIHRKEEEEQIIAFFFLSLSMSDT